MTAVENRMVIGEYYGDDARAYILDISQPRHYAEYVYENCLEDQMFAAWLGAKLTDAAAEDLWEHLDDSFVDGLCQRWVEAHCLDGFLKWRYGYYGSIR